MDPTRGAASSHEDATDPQEESLRARPRERGGGQGHQEQRDAESHQELADQRLVSFAEQLGQVELEIVLYYRDEALSARVGEVIADMEGLK